MKNLYEIFETNADEEVSGVWQDFGSARIKLARAGGRNTTYAKTFAKVMKRYNKVNYESLKDEEADLIIAEVFAKAVIKAWEIKNEFDQWESGLILKVDGEFTKVEFNVKNVTQCLIDLPDLFSKLREFANEMKTFQAQVEEEQLGN